MNQFEKRFKTNASNKFESFSTPELQNPRAYCVNVVRQTDELFKQIHDDLTEPVHEG